MPTLPKIFRPVTQNIFLFGLTAMHDLLLQIVYKIILNYLPPSVDSRILSKNSSAQDQVRQYVKLDPNPKCCTFWWSDEIPEIIFWKC